jgi:hypothetical protein
MKHFPYESFQGDQEETINNLIQAIVDGQKSIELSAPTASGKTVVLYTVGRNLVDLGHTVVYTTDSLAGSIEIGTWHSYSKRSQALPLSGDKNNRSGVYLRQTQFKS